MIQRRFLVWLGAAYVATVVILTCSINSYFSAGWDPQIFAQVGRAVIDNSSVFDLYQASRQTWGDWGYPYPPLYAHLLAPFLGISSLIPALPDWLLVRAVPVIFDLIVAVLVYVAILRRSGQQALACAGAAIWLFNPLTLYQTAIQAHQESTWLACTVAAFALLENKRAAHGWLERSGFLPSLLMACAVTFKQSAILFYIPFVIFLASRDLRGLRDLGDLRSWRRLLVAGTLFALVFGGLSLPYHLHSPDFFYLVYVDVSNMPVQTQSAVVWLLGLPEYLTEQTRSSFFLLKYQSIITMTLAALLSFLALRRNPDLFRVGLLVALLFFLTSKKVMGYHYVLVAPFLLIVCLPQRRFDLIGIVLLAASWIVLSPYYAPWARPQHLALYAAIATPNTVLWLWLLWHVWRGHSAILVGRFNLTQRLADGSAVMIGLAVVTLGMILSGLGQPWGASIPAAQIALLVAVVAGALLLAVPAARLVWQPARRLEAGHVAIAVLVLPVYFAAFTLTAESTRIIEGLLP